MRWREGVGEEIQQFYRILSVLQSKQRPRKIFGNDNNKYD